MQYINSPLSDKDINRAIHKIDRRGANIISDKIIEPNTPIEKIFNNRGHIIIHHQYKNSTVGHWYMCLRDPEKNVYFFDSFGKSPNFYNKSILQCFKNNGIKKVFINNQVWQNKDSAVCGRYGILLAGLWKAGLNLNQIYDFLKDGEKRCGSFDKLVLDMTT